MADAIIHNEEPTSQDKLNRQQYARALAQVARTCETPLVIGLYGTWGIGKTSLMKQIQKELTESNNSINTVWFDAWMHQFDESPSLALLHTVVNTFDMKEEGKKLLAVIASAFGSLLLKTTTTLELKDVDELGKRYEEERFQAREARVRMREYFQELIAKARGSEKHRLVFFIDDLDRCLPAQTLALLEALKLYLNLQGCVYFLGVDREALEHSVRFHYKETEISETSYLDKIVQLPFTIPPLAPESMDDFVGSLLPEELKSCNELLVKGLGDNPRQVKRFISTLTLNHLLASELKIPQYNPKILAVILLLQVLAPDLYRLLPRKPNILETLKSEEGKSLAASDSLREALGTMKFSSNTSWQRYIYLTEVARIAEKEPLVLEIDLGDIKSILASHKEWLTSGGKKGMRANLSGADLNLASLAGADLRASNLSEANLRRANLSGANLSEARLRSAFLNGAELTMANLFVADLDEAKLIRATLVGANLLEAGLVGADLRGADLTDANLTGADLSGTNLNGAKLRKTNLCESNLYGATGMTEEQLASAKTNELTILPNGTKGPFKLGSGSHRSLTERG